MVAVDGCAPRSRRVAGGDRAGDSRDGNAARRISGRGAPVLHRGGRETHRPRRAGERAQAARMNAMKLLMPLRVPELAPSLGRIIVPRRLLDPWVPLDDIREALATRALELGGEGRAVEDRARILDVTGRRAWSAAWDHAVRRAGARVADALDAEITRTA